MIIKCLIIGDIFFGVAFIPALDEGQDKDDIEVEIIEEINHVNSSTETICGNFKLPCEGVVLIMFDNGYDWTSIKKLSYVIEVTEVSQFNVFISHNYHII